MLVQTYLSFEGRCEEALEFYRRAAGAEVQMLMRFKESPEPAPEGAVPRGTENKVLHAAFKIGETVVLASDGRCSGKADFKGFGLTISVNDSAAADKVFAALSDGGQVTMPLGKTFWSSRFGMLTDRFGVCWMVNTVTP
ncbi:MAG TPA: VOC family protein [Burkholderiaceae bacterium]|nr:VOC family protein [Burkholderiaceae bacterium]